MDAFEVANNEAVKIAGIAIAVTFVSCIFIEFLLSKVLKRNYASSQYLIINLSVAFLQQLTDLLNKGVFLFAFVWVQQHYSLQDLFGWKKIEAVNPFSPFNPLQLFNYFLVIVIADFCQYWLHRFSHEINIMWAGHVTHHSNSEYNLSVAVRQSAVEGIYTWVFFMPLAFFGIPWQLFVLAYSVSLLWQFLVHTQFVKRLGFLETFMATPSHHRVHHGKNERYIDKNYGAFFIVWDKLFGTFEPETEKVEYGITQPLQNENPLWSNVHHHADILKRVWNDESVSGKMKWLFGKPSAIYGKEKVTASATQFTPQSEKVVYVFINFLLTAVAGFLLMNTIEQTRNLWLYAATAGGVFVCFSIYTALLENKKWADYAEAARLCVMLAGGVVLIANTENLLGWAVTGSAICFIVFTLFIAAKYRSYSSAL
ncbi:MAG: sterol desaturase family protein [Chitinophagales bacterium]|nr:sterol desaturase family protein [Chitinophagales bacterium]